MNKGVIAMVQQLIQEEIKKLQSENKIDLESVKSSIYKSDVFEDKN